MKNYFLKLLILAFVILLPLSACRSEKKAELEVIDKPETRTESLLHTVVQLSIYHENQDKTMADAIAYIKDMEALLSTNLEGSDVYKINHAAGKEAVKVRKETFEILEAAIGMSQNSQGKFDVTIGAVSNLWKIGDTDARVPAPEEISAALANIDYRKIKLNKAEQTVYIEEGMTLELGAISKGFIADGVKDVFEKHGVTRAIINLGGNVLVMGTSPKSPDGWTVGVQNPDAIRGETVGAVKVIDSSVVTSGIYERYIEGKDGTIYHHILDPKTGYPVENNISGVTVYTKTSLQGDELSTSLFLLGIEEGMKLVNKTAGVEVVFIDKDGGIHLSKGLKNRFELRNEDYRIVD